MKEMKLIKTVEDLQNIHDDLTRSYQIVNDIDATVTKTWNNGRGFDPIGDFEEPFTGTVWGGRHRIKGLFISRPDDMEIGLFGNIRGEAAVIIDIFIEDAWVEGDDNVGILVGRCETGSLVSGCRTEGFAIAESWGVGGLIGVSCGRVAQCGADAHVEGEECVGGLVGSLYEGSLSKVWARGTVVGLKDVGWLIGHHLDGDVIVGTPPRSYSQYPAHEITTETTIRSLYGCDFAKDRKALKRLISMGVRRPFLRYTTSSTHELNFQEVLQSLMQEGRK